MTGGRLPDVAGDALLAHLVVEGPRASELLGTLRLDAGNTLREGIVLLLAAAALDRARDVVLVEAANGSSALSDAGLQARVHGVRAGLSAMKEEWRVVKRV